MATKAKTIKMLLYDGSLKGVTNISDSAWAIGNMYSAPRESISNLISRADCKRYGVYLLLSDKQVYVGQASDLERRTKQHLADKSWWNRVILMTTKDDSFNASDIDYLESKLISLAAKAGTLDSDNKKKGNPQKVDEFRQAELDDYLEEALFLFELIGVKVFINIGMKAKGATKLSSDVLKTRPIAIQAATTGQLKPPLPDPALKPGTFVRTAMKALLASGFVFSEEQIRAFSSVEGSRQFTTRNLPLILLLKDGQPQETGNLRRRKRYWSEEFVSGKHRFLMYSQWYDNFRHGATKEDFVKWYNSL